MNGPASGLDLDLRPDGVAIAAGALQAETNPVMAGRCVIAQQRRRAVLVADDQVDVAIVV